MVALDTIKQEFNINEMQSQYMNKSPQQILRLALAQFDNIAISFSGAEDV